MIEKMHERIKIQKSTAVNDENGNHVAVWKDYYKCFAYVNNLSGREYWEAAETNSQDEVTFIIRYCKKAAQLSSDHYRVIFRGRIYNITFIDNVQYGDRTLKIRASGKER